MHRVLLLVLALAGCDKVFDLHRDDLPCWNDELVDDEDGDKLADGCDFCPAFANGAADDVDRDLILDPCDPSDESQQLVDFAGFAGDQDFEGWSAGSWAVQGGSIAQHDPTAMQMTRKQLPATVNPSIEAPVAFLDPVMGGYANVGFDLAGVQVSCRYEYASDDDKVVLEWGGAPVVTRYNAGPGLRLRLYQSMDGVLHCQARDATGASEEIVSDGPLLQATTTLATLEANAIAGYAWVMILGADSPTR